MVPCVSIVPMILMSPGPHMAHPRGSCIPTFPQYPFLMMSMSSGPCLSSWHPHVPLSPRSLCPHGLPSPQRLYPRCSHSIPPCPHTVPPCPQAGLARCQREAEEVVELMRQNVARALEREGHLEQLQSRAQDLRQAVGARGQAPGHTAVGEWH